MLTQTVVKDLELLLVIYQKNNKQNYRTKNWFHQSFIALVSVMLCWRLLITYVYKYIVAMKLNFDEIAINLLPIMIQENHNTEFLSFFQLGDNFSLFVTLGNHLAIIMSQRRRLWDYSSKIIDIVIISLRAWHSIFTLWSRCFLHCSFPHKILGT